MAYNYMGIYYYFPDNAKDGDVVTIIEPEFNDNSYKEWIFMNNKWLDLEKYLKEEIKNE